MKPVLAAAALAGLSASAHAQSTGITITASKTSIAGSESVTFTVSITNDLDPGNFGWYLQSIFVNLEASVSNAGTASAFTFNHATTDLNGLGNPYALISDSAPDASGSLNSLHWQVNNLNGDAVNDYIIGDTFESSYVLGSFSWHWNGIVTGWLSFDVTPDQDFIDSQVSVNAPLNWGSGSLGFSDTVRTFTDWTVISDSVLLPPAPGTAALLGFAAIGAGVRRRPSS